MSEIDNRTPEHARADVGLQPGVRLAEARERLKLSAADVARQLKLSVAQVEALESGQFERLPGVVFVRGFIRNYARLVKLDPDELLEAAAGSLPQQSARPEAPPSQNIPFPSSRPRRSRKYIWGAMVLVAALAFYEFFVSSEETVVTTHPIEVTPPPLPLTTPKEEKSPEPVAAVPEPKTASPGPIAAPAKPMAAPSNAGKAVTAEKAPAPSQASTQPARAATKQSAAEPAKAAPAPEDSVTPPPAAAVAPAPQPESASVRPEPAERQVTLVFEDESWVEIRDRHGKVLLYQLNLPGTREAVNGLPPLSFVIGNPQSVRLTYDDRAVDLEPHSKTGVARMTLE